MTAGAGAALSHVLIGVGRMAFFQLIRRREFAAPDRTRLPLAEARGDFVPPPDAWLHEP